VHSAKLVPLRRHATVSSFSYHSGTDASMANLGVHPFDNFVGTVDGREFFDWMVL
jgi:hypothetical protein